MNRMLRNPWFYLLLIILLGAALRFLGLFHDFWLDEIWAFNNIFLLKSPLEIFTSSFDAANHHLTSLFIYLVDKENPSYWYKYRILSFLSGIGAILLSFLISNKIFSDKKGALLVSLLTALSFPLVAFSSEARGYSLEILFSLLSFYLFLEYLDKKRPWILGSFYASLILGFLSHITFIFIAVGLAGAYYVHLNIKRIPMRQKIFSVIKTFFVPGMVVFILLFKYVMNLMVCGGARPSLANIANAIIMSLVGVADENFLTYGLGILLFILMAREIKYIFKKNPEMGSFIGAVIFAPVIFIMILRPEYLYFRHFLCLYPFLIIVLSHLLYRLGASSAKLRALALILLAFIIAGNIRESIHFLKIGRGNYFNVFAYMAEHTESPEITITSDHDFKNLTLLSFYSFFFDEKKLVYTPFEELSERGARPEWIITHSKDRNPRMRQSIELNKSGYALKVFSPSYVDFFGCHWFLYRREDGVHA